MLDCLIVLGLIVNFFAFVVFTGQQVNINISFPILQCSLRSTSLMRCVQVQAVAQAGQLPRLLAYRHPTTDAPIIASVSASVVGLVLTACFAYTFGEEGAQGKRREHVQIGEYLSYPFFNFIIFNCDVIISPPSIFPSDSCSHVHVYVCVCTADTMVTAALIPAVCGYLMILECLATVWRAEGMHREESHAEDKMR